MLPRVRRELTALVLGTATAACGGRSSSVVGERPEPEFPAAPAVPFACGGERKARPAAPVSRRTLASAEALRLEAVSDDGALVAYSTLNPGVPVPGVGVLLKDFFEVPGAGGDSLPVASQVQEFPGRFTISTRFEGRTLLVIWGIQGDTAEGLMVFRPGDETATPIASAVDPTAVRASRDGRFLSVEANDRRHDLNQLVDLLLVELSTLETTLVDRLDLARARFTRDSSYLVYSGRGSEDCRVSIERLSLGDRTVNHVTCIQTDGRWEASPDGEWLVHGDAWSHLVPDPSMFENCPTALVKTPLAGGDPAVLADCSLGAGGKELDVARGGAEVSFLTRAVEPDGTGARLMTVPLAGGEATELAPSGATSIVEHLPGVVAFVGSREREVTCGDGAVNAFGPLLTVPTAGGPVQHLGWASYCADPPFTGTATLSELDGSLLVLGADGGLRYQPSPGAPPLLVGCDIAQAAFRDAHRILFSGRRDGVLGLFGYDADTGEIEELEPLIEGPFGGGPELGDAYFAVVPGAEGESASSLVGGSF